MLIEANRTTGIVDKAIVLLVILCALGMLIWGIFAIVRSTINHDDHGR